MATVIQQRPAAAMMHAAAACLVWAIHLLFTRTVMAAACGTGLYASYPPGDMIAPVVVAAGTVAASVALAAIAGTVLINVGCDRGSAVLRTPCLAIVALFEFAVIVQSVPVLLLQACG